MKATKKIVGATAALVAAVALSAGSTFAWFATNSTVTATGLSVGVTESTNANLLIRALQSDGSAYTAYGSTAAFNHGTKKFTPSTHDSNYTSYSSGLKACGDASKVDPITGIYSGDSWTQTTEGTHYFDYTVQLANAGVDSYSGEYLTATLSGTTALAMQYAISIDFYYQSTASTNYAGTINLAGIELNGTGTGNRHRSIVQIDTE